MPLKKSYSKKRTYRKRSYRKTYRKRLTRNSKRNPNNIGGPNTAKIMQITTPPSGQNILLANNGYTATRNGLVGDRAIALAQQYGLYRIARITVKFKPNFDTYVSNPAFVGGNGPVNVPYLYYMINRYGDWPANLTEEYFKVMGAKPVRFDDKLITVSWKPNILMATSANAGSDSGQVKMTPWLSTDAVVGDQAFQASTTKHYGIGFIISCATNGNGQTPVGTFEVESVYEFKQPRYISGSGFSNPLDLSGNEIVSHTSVITL